MSKADKADVSDKQAAAKAAIRNAKGMPGVKPRSAEKDFWVFTCGVGSLIYVLMTMGPS